MTRERSMRRNPGRLVDADLELVLYKRTPGDPRKGRVPEYRFEMRKVGGRMRLGEIRLRIGRTRYLTRYAGQIGYTVHKRYRGHHYAARSCRLLFPLAYALGLKTLWITCDPKNMASRRTCKRIGAEYVETVRIPKETHMYQRGRRYTRRYKVNLRKALARPEQP